MKLNTVENTIMKLAKEDIDTPEKRGKYTVSIVGYGKPSIETACLFADAGFKVIAVGAGQQVTNPSWPQLDALMKKSTKKGLIKSTTNARNAASASDIIIFTVQTPLNKRKNPDYSHVEKACREVGMGLRSGSLIIFQSATGPGVTETLVKETLENASGLKAGGDFGLAYCPIHAHPEQTPDNICNYVRIIGAINNQSLEDAFLVLGTITKGKILKVRNIKTAEAVRMFENAHLDVNLAMANELARFCEKTGIDFFEAKEAANTQPYCHLQDPGIVGQASKDTYLLTEEAEEANVKLRVLGLASKTNDEMLGHTLHLARDALRLCGKTFRRAKIAVFGVSNRPNAKEYGSSAKRLVNMLKRKGATVQVYDPLFSYKELLNNGYPVKRTLTKTVEGVDLIIIAVGHDRFRRLNLGKIRLLVKNPAALVDVAHVIGPEKAEKKGFAYRGLGRGLWTKVST
jgi:nucleotide sugar dehydrogenase